jgi:tetratricopeptide (TPR) repeat protein
VGDFEEGTRWHEAALAAFRELGDEEGTAHMLFRLAVEANRVGDPTRARALCDESLSLHHSVSGQAQVLTLLGNIAFDEGRGQEALELLEESARLAGEAGFRWWQLHALQTYAEYALKLNKPDAASGPACEALEMARSINDRQGIFFGVALLAWLAAEKGQTAESGRLWGALEAEAVRAPVGQWELERDEYATRIVRTTPAFERGYQQGHRLLLEQAVDEALHARE